MDTTTHPEALMDHFAALSAATDAAEDLFAGDRRMTGVTFNLAQIDPSLGGMAEPYATFTRARTGAPVLVGRFATAQAAATAGAHAFLAAL